MLSAVETIAATAPASRIPAIHQGKSVVRALGRTISASARARGPNSTIAQSPIVIAPA